MAIKDVILGYAKGEKGDQGPQGAKGETGATGPKGDPGNIADAQITDTEGLDVAKGQKTTAQKLFDAIANRIVTKLVTNDALTNKLADYMLKGMMSNTNVNNTGTVPTSALMYSMFEQINNNLLGEPAPYNTNLNDLINGGVWMVQTDGDKIDQNNFPQEVVNGWVRVYKNSNGAIKQVFYRYGTNDKTDGYVYTRTYNVNSKNWSRWTSYARMSDLGDLITHRKTTGNTSDSGNITINRPEGYSLIGAYINSVYVRLSIPTVYQKTIIVRCFDENMSPLKNTLVEVISLWIKKDISY